MKNILTFVCSTLTMLMSLHIEASPNLMLFPTRLVFEKNKRAYQVELSNNGTSPGTYRISLENKRMTEVGKFVPAEPLWPTELSAEKILSFSPRQVTLAPGASQTVRIILRKPADLPAGEYRSHLVLTRLPDPVNVLIESTVKKSEVGIQITPLIGASIPILVEHGTTNASVKLTKIKYFAAHNKVPAEIEFNIEREGNQSVYGDLFVSHVSADGTTTELETVKGIALYSPYPLRKAKIILQNEEAPALKKGKLVIQFKETRNSNNKILAEGSVDI